MGDHVLCFEVLERLEEQLMGRWRRLHDYLSGARSAVLWKLDDLSEFDVRRPLTPTGTNLLGPVKHLGGAKSPGVLLSDAYSRRVVGWSIEAPPVRGVVVTVAGIPERARASPPAISLTLWVEGWLGPRGLLGSGR